MKFKGSNTQLLDYLEANYYQIGSNIKITEESRKEGLRGILILPEDLDNYINEKLGIQHFVTEKFSIHMFCLNFESNLIFFFKFSINLNLLVLNQLDKTFLYSHLIDIQGISIKKEDLNKNLLLYFMLCCFFISKSEVSL